MNEHSHARIAILAIYKQTTMWLLHTILSNTTQASTKKGFYMKKEGSYFSCASYRSPKRTDSYEQFVSGKSINP